MINFSVAIVFEHFFGWIFGPMCGVSSSNTKGYFFRVALRPSSNLLLSATILYNLDSLVSLGRKVEKSRAFLALATICAQYSTLQVFCSERRPFTSCQ